MEFRQLEAFRLIVDTGSFSETAKQMGVTQPSVSAQISALEREFGSLLLRQPGKAIPTETGKALYRYATEILSLRDRVVDTYGRRQGLSGTITISASSIPYQFILPVLTAQFSMQYPDVRFTLTGGDSASATSLVLEGKADIGMVGTIFKNDALHYEPILEDELMVVTPAAPPYTQWHKGTAKIEDILQSPFVAREEGSGTWTEVENYLERQGYDSSALKVVARIDNPDTIVKSVEQGLGITMLSSLAASDYTRKGTVQTFSLEGNPAKRKIFLIYKKEQTLPPVTEAFAKFAARLSHNN